MFFRKKIENYDTPADIHLRCLSKKISKTRTSLHEIARTVEGMQTVISILPEGDYRKEATKRLKECKDHLVECATAYENSISDYNNYYEGTKSSRVTTAEWTTKVADVVSVIYNAVNIVKV